MKTHFMDLVVNRPKKNDLPGPPHMKIVPIRVGENGPYLTPSCFGIAEMNAAINVLIMELEALRDKAKREFSKE